jgi:hypothetical protein
MRANLTAHVLALSAALAFSSLALRAGDLPADDKSQYTIANPTPDSLLRPITSGEFDSIINPFTIDAGHFQIDADFVEWYDLTRRGTFPNGTTYDYYQQELVWAPTLRLGVYNNVEFNVQPGYENYSWHQTGVVSGGGPYVATYSKEFFDYTDLGVRINLWGNDTGVTALGIQPYIGIPADGGDLLGGIDIPFAVRLPMDFMVKYTPGFYAIEAGKRTIHGEIANRFAVDKKFFGKLTGFWDLNLLSTSQSGQRGWGYTGFGAGYEVTPNLLLYAAIRFGMGEAYDVNPYAGFAWRF